MCNFSNVIDFFIRDYAQQTLPILYCREEGMKTSYMPDKLSKEKYVLSHNEYSRLQRAFVRFELYCNLFSPCERDPYRCKVAGSQEKTTGLEQAKLFLLHYTADEIAELHCIYEYLDRVMEGVFNSVEDTAVRWPRRGYYDLQSSCGNGFEGCPCLFQDRDDDFWMIIEHIISLGLDYLLRIAAARDRNKWVDLMLHCRHRCGADVFEAHTLCDALMVYEDIDELRRHYEETKGDWSLSPGDRDYIPRSCGWDHLMGASKNYADALAKGSGIRKWGYPFWDHDRLKDAGVLDADGYVTWCDRDESFALTLDFVVNHILLAMIHLR